MKSNRWVFAGISRKLTLAFLVVTGVIIAVGVFIHVKTGVIVDATGQMTRTVLLVHDGTQRVREAMLEELLALEQVHRLDHAVAEADFLKAREKMADAVNVLRNKSLLNSTELDSLTSLENRFHVQVERMFRVQAQLSRMAMHHMGTDSLATSHQHMMAMLDTESLRLQNLLTSLDWEARQVTDEKQLESGLAVTNVRISQSLMLCLAIIATVFVGISARRNIADPMRRLTAGAKLVGAGKFGHRIDTGGTGEIKILEEAFNRMAVELRRSGYRQTLLQMEPMDEQRDTHVGDLTPPILQSLRGLVSNVLAAAYPLKQCLPVAQEVSVIERTAQSMEMFVNELLHKTRQDHERGERLIDLNDMITDELSILELGREFSTGIMKELRLAPNLPMVKARYPDVSHAFLNLIQNARDAMCRSRQKTLIISTRSDQTCVIIDIQDTGCGIPDEHLPKIFDPFFTTKQLIVGRPGEEPSGIGLGLWSCRQLLTPYGATFEVRSTPGAGSRFTVKFPLISADSEDIEG